MLLQNLYRKKIIGFDYSDPFYPNEKNNFEKSSNLHELNSNISKCHLCDLSKSRTQSMSGFGSQKAQLMIIDFCVSATEDSTNSYYCGRSGEILKNMINNVLKMDTKDIFFTHAIKCKPLNSNIPSLSEFNSCKNYLFSQIEFIKPKVIVTLGKDAYCKLTSQDDNGDFEKIRGHVIDFNNYKLIPIHHPQYLLRNPQFKKTALNDLNIIKNCLQSSKSL